MKKTRQYAGLLAALFLISVLLFGCSYVDLPFAADQSAKQTIQAEDIPEYSGEPYVVLNDNEPEFTEDEITDESFEEYGPLDELGRCQAAIASVGQDLMPTTKRGSISRVKPTGWQSVTYDFVDGNSLSSDRLPADRRKCE
jgi:DNA-entry nuclease